MMRNKKGFTLAELLIVIAIIAVLTAVAVPVFSASQKKAKLAVDHAAIRDAYAIVQIANNLQEVEIDGTTYTFDQMAEDSFYAARGYTFLLSNDCSALYTPNFFGIHTGDDYYCLQASGVSDSSDPCPDCVQWDNWGVDPAQYFLPVSQLHTEGNNILVTFDKAQRKMVLGYLVYA